MELVKKLYPVKDKNGVSKTWCIFKCPLCGNFVERFYSATNQKSCGCKKRKYNGEAKTKMYHKWADMKHRCNNHINKHYRSYGGRGIKICDEWQESFFNFKEWALQNGYSDNLHIDRIDNDGNYEPSNCRFVTHHKNNTNKTTSILQWVHVDAIRDLSNNGVSNKELSEIFGTERSHISKIIHNRVWKLEFLRKEK